MLTRVEWKQIKAAMEIYDSALEFDSSKFMDFLEAYVEEEIDYDSLRKKAVENERNCYGGSFSEIHYGRKPPDSALYPQKISEK